MAKQVAWKHYWNYVCFKNLRITFLILLLSYYWIKSISSQRITQLGSISWLRFYSGRFILFSKVFFCPSAFFPSILIFSFSCTSLWTHFVVKAHQCLSTSEVNLILEWHHFWWFMKLDYGKMRLLCLSNQCSSYFFYFPKEK